MCPGRPESAAPAADGAPDGAAIEVGETAVFKALRKGTTWAFKISCNAYGEPVPNSLERVGGAMEVAIMPSLSGVA